MWRAPIEGTLHPATTPRLVGRYRVTSPYGWRTLNKVRSFHTGLDIGNGRTAGPVVAIAAGRVIAVGYLTAPWSDRSTAFGTGNFGGLMVVIDHGNGRISVYAHLGSEAVTVGQQLAAGDRIGTIGDSGSAKGQPHLHLDVWFNGNRVDPWPLLSSGWWPEMQLTEKHEPWILPVGAEVFPEGPGIGRRLIVTVAERVRSLVEAPPAAGGWRLIRLEDGRLVWTRRIVGAKTSIAPIRRGGIPSYDAAVKAVADLGKEL